MDWAWLFYLGTNILNMPEEKFLKCTLRKLDAMHKLHLEVNGLKKEEDKKGYIDDVIF